MTGSALHAASARDQRRAAARAALTVMKGARGWLAEVDDGSLDFLATEISQQVMQELARRWAPAMGYPTPLTLALAAERIYVQAAVAALDA